MILRLLQIIMIAAVLAAPLGDLLATRAQAETSKPNFVVFLIDDLDSASVESMEEVNRLLAARGMTFSRFFATTPLCCPSRASILRGQYAHNHGVLRNTGEDAGFSAFQESGSETQTMATLLDAAGYETALIGKYLNGYSPRGDRGGYVPPGWDFWAAGVGHAAYANFNYQLNVNGELFNYGDRDADYLTDVLAGYTRDFLDGVASSGQPFLLYLAPYAPHSPATPAPRHKGLFRGTKAPRSPAFNQRRVRKKPRWITSTKRLTSTRIDKIDEGFAMRLESLQAVDEMIGAVVQQLEDQGVLDNTYLFFLSDNGYFLGEYRQPHGKDAPYDAAARVPLIVRGPGIPSGSTTGKIALNLDLLPTMLDLAGSTSPPFVDGRSLRPLLNDNERHWRRSALIEGFGKETESNEPGESSTPPFRALRTERVLYVEYETGEHELYDLRRDPHQLTNIVSNSSKALRRIYSRRLGQLAACAGSECQSIENEPLAVRARDRKKTRRGKENTESQRRRPERAERRDRGRS